MICDLNALSENDFQECFKA